MTVKEYIQFTQLAWMIIGMYLLFFAIISIDMQPDKKTRKTIRKIAKEKKIKRYVIVNSILKMYCDYYEAEAMKKEAAQNVHRTKIEPTYEEWKKEIEAKEKKPIKVKPKIKHQDD